MRCSPVRAGHPDPGFRLLQATPGVAEIRAAGALEQIPPNRRHVAYLRRSAGQERFCREILARSGQRDLIDFINNPPPLHAPEPREATPAARPKPTPEPIAPANATEPERAEGGESVAWIQALKAKGLTLDAIAQQLDADSVPTISGKGHWQKGTISNLLTQAEGATHAGARH